MPSWKVTQSKKQKARKTKWAIYIIAIILGLFVLGNSVKFIQILFNPWQSKVLNKAYMWQGEFNINLLVRAKNISVLSYSPSNQQIFILEIPQNSYLDVAGGFGKWELRSIYDLGGDPLLKQTIVNLLGMPIDGFLNFQGKYSQMETKSIVEQFRKDPFNLLNLLPNLKTDLTPFELLKLKMGLASVRFDKIKQVDLVKFNLFQLETLPDGTKVFTPDLVQLDSQVSELAEPFLQAEHKTIAIFNATSHPLLAQKAARLITNIGGNVIITSNGQEKFAKTTIMGEKSKTLDRLKQIFGLGGTIDPKLEDLVKSRAQINIFLGEDYFKQ